MFNKKISIQFKEKSTKYRCFYTTQNHSCFFFRDHPPNSVWTEVHPALSCQAAELEAVTMSQRPAEDSHLQSCREKSMEMCKNILRLNRFVASCYVTILSGQVTHCKDASKAGVLCFTSLTFCNNNISCSLRLNERIYDRTHSSVFYLLELAFMINLHNSVASSNIKFHIISENPPLYIFSNVTIQAKLFFRDIEVLDIEVPEPSKDFEVPVTLSSHTLYVGSAYNLLLT